MPGMVNTRTLLPVARRDANRNVSALQTDCSCHLSLALQFIMNKLRTARHSGSRLNGVEEHQSSKNALVGKSSHSGCVLHWRVQPSPWAEIDRTHANAWLSHETLTPTTKVTLIQPRSPMLMNNLTNQTHANFGKFTSIAIQPLQLLETRNDLQPARISSLLDHTSDTTGGPADRRVYRSVVLSQWSPGTAALIQSVIVWSRWALLLPCLARVVVVLRSYSCCRFSVEGDNSETHQSNSKGRLCTVDSCWPQQRGCGTLEEGRAA